MKYEAEQECDDQKEDYRIRNSKQAPQPQGRERVRNAETWRSVGGHVNEAAHDGHCAECGDEWIDAEIGNQPTVRHAHEEARNDSAHDSDRDAERPEVDHQRRSDDAGQRGDRTDRKIKAAKDYRERHTARDNPDHGILLQDIGEILIGPKGRLRNEHAGDEQDEDKKDAMAPRRGESPAPPTGHDRHEPFPDDVVAPVIMLTISSGRVLLVSR